MTTSTKTTAHGPTIPFSEAIHAEKYRGKGESFREAMNRVAAGLMKDEGDERYKEFREVLLDMRFMPAGRVQSAIGSTRNVTPYNCYVSGTIEDSFVDGTGSIMARAREAAATMRMGGGIGYDFSTLRPRGDLIRKLQSHSSGPITFMEIFDAICRCVASSGHRRGAQMGVLRIDHPNVEEFIRSKQPPKATEPILEQLADQEPGSAGWQRWYDALQAVYKLTGFNISLAITDEFMECLVDQKPFPLRYDGQVHREVDPTNLWEMVMRSTWDWAEPGALFVDTINRMNNLWYCERIAATNPCFTGDTRVWTAEHGHVQFRKLVGRDIEVLAQAADGRLVYRTMKNIRRTQRAARLVRVRLSGGREVRCTPQHKFFLKGGRKVAAEELKAGDRLQSVYRCDANQKGYKRLKNGIDAPLEHHVGFPDLGEDEHMHHKNGDKGDNRPSNLERMPAREHNSMHMRGDRNPLRTHPHRNPMKLDPDCTRGEKNGRWRGDLDTQRMMEMRESGLSFAAIAEEVGCSKYTARNRILEANHRVVGVDWLDEREDVYCGTVEDPTHRFFVALSEDEGVLVSNCGEQPLPPYGACLLGSFNLVKYVAERSDGSRYFAWDLLEQDVPLVVRAMDNVVDRATYPLYEQEKEARSKRRMGLGVTGLANALEALGQPYASEGFLEMTNTVLGFICNSCYAASAELAAEKGVFPLYDREKYRQGRFIARLHEDVRDMIDTHGIRNSHLTSIAPTGTISMCADNVSSGIEPVFAYRQRRRVNMPGGEVETEFDDYGYRVWGVEGRRASEVTAHQHLQVLSTAYGYVDSAVSKTCNVPPSMPWEEFKGLYLAAWRHGCKGITTYQTGGKRAGILTAADDDSGNSVDEAACRIDPETGRRECE